MTDVAGKAANREFLLIGRKPGCAPNGRTNEKADAPLRDAREQIECLRRVSFGDFVLAPEDGLIAWALVIFPRQSVIMTPLSCLILPWRLSSKADYTVYAFE